MKLTVDKGYIDRTIGLGGFRSINVEMLTEAFLHEIMKHLLDGKEVYLRGFGTFKVSIRKGKMKNRVTLTQGTGRKGERVGTKTLTIKKKYYVSFKRARAFREMFQERFSKKKAKKS